MAACWYRLERPKGVLSLSYNLLLCILGFVINIHVPAAAQYLCMLVAKHTNSCCHLAPCTVPSLMVANCTPEECKECMSWCACKAVLTRLSLPCVVMIVSLCPAACFCWNDLRRLRPDTSLAPVSSINWRVYLLPFCGWASSTS